MATTRAQSVAQVQQASGGPVPPMVAGKNKIINGDFNINQRAFTSTTTSSTYGFDRWKIFVTGGGGACTYSAQTFTPGTAPVTGYESANFARVLTSGLSAASDYMLFAQNIEDVKTLANQTATISFWAKSASGTPKVAIEISQNFGSGGSPSSSVNTYVSQATISTSWTRYTITVSIPSISGKTIGSTANTSLLGINFWVSAGSDYNSRSGSLGTQNNTFDFWGVQVEAGSTATPFQTATGTIQGELAACQRYFYNGGNTIGSMNTSGQALFIHNLPVPMRTTPSMAFTGTATVSQPGVATYTTTTQPSSISQTQASNAQIYFAMTGLGATVASGPAYSQTLITLSAEL